MPSTHGAAASAAEHHGEALGHVREAGNAWGEQLVDLSGIKLPGLSRGLGMAEQSLIGIVSGTGLSAAGLLGLATAGAIAEAEAVKVAAEWQHVETSIAAAANTSVAAAERVGAAFMELGTEVPASGMKIAQAYETVAGRLQVYTGAALGSSEATEFMRIAAEGAAASGQDLTSVTGALTQQIMASHSSMGEADRVMNALYITSRNTGMGFEQLSMIAGRLQAKLGEAAPDIEGVGLALTFAAEAGIQGQRAMLPVISTIESLADPSAKAKENFEALGIQILKNKDGTLDLAGTFQSLKAGYDSLSTEAQKHALAEELAGKNAGTLESMLKLSNAQIEHAVSLYQDHNRVAQDAAKHTGDLTEHMEKLGNRVQATMVEHFGPYAKLLVIVGDETDKAAKHQELLNIAMAQYPGRADAARVAADAYVASLEKINTTYEHLEANRGRGGIGMGPGPEYGQTQSEQNTRPQIDVAGLRDNAQLMGYLGSEGEKFHQTMLKISQASLPSDLKAGLDELLIDEVKQEEAFRKAFDPAHPEIAGQRIATLHRLTDDYTAAAILANRTGEQGDIDRRNAAQAAIDSFNGQITAQTRLGDETKKIEAYQRSQESAARQAAAEAKRAAEEAARAIKATALSGFDDAQVHNELVQKWGKLGGDSIIALTQALSDPANMRQAGEQLDNSIAGLTTKLHEAGVADWEQMGAALVAAFRQAIVDGTPESIQAAQDLLTATVAVYQTAEIATEWGKAQTSAMEKVDVAWRNHEESMTALRERHTEKQYFDESTATVKLWVDATKIVLDKELGDQRHADQNVLESMRLAATEKDHILSQQRQVEDVGVSRGRQIRDVGIQLQRQQQDAASAHAQRLADIASRGGPGQAAAIAAENESFRRQQAASQLQQSRAEQDRQRANADADADRAKQIAREQADLSRHEMNAIAEKARAQGFQDSEKAQAIANTAHVADYKTYLEKQFHIDKLSMDIAEESRQIQQIDRTYAHAGAAYVAEMTKAHETLDRKYPNEFLPAVTPYDPSRQSLPAPYGTWTSPSAGGGGALPPGSYGSLENLRSRTGPLVVWNSYGTVGDTAVEGVKSVLQAAATQIAGGQ